jgi:hypothetical protein
MFERKDACERLRLSKNLQRVIDHSASSAMVAQSRSVRTDCTWVQKFVRCNNAQKISI